MNAALRPAAESLAYPAMSLALVLALWVAAAASGVVPEAVLPGPGAVARAALEEGKNGRLWIHLYASGWRLAIGFLIGAASGVVLGLILGMAATARAAVMPIVEIVRPIPPLAWIPLALIWFGIGEPSKVFLIALTSSFPVLIATFKGVQQIEVALIRAAQSLDVTPRQMLYAVILPAAAPDVVTGLRLGWSLAITVLVGAEMIAAGSGLGFLVMDGMNNGRFDHVVLGILILGTLSVLTDAAFMRLSRSRLLRWHAGLDKATL